ncbi:hypothetical protein HanRHA438_Chr14g0649741 [Helianthus annuus]|nr:hypothetical protein HanRHA438_Chr14g0649741 [Helianthus annuus]
MRIHHYLLQSLPTSKPPQHHRQPRLPPSSTIDSRVLTTTTHHRSDRRPRGWPTGDDGWFLYLRRSSLSVSAVV